MTAADYGRASDIFDLVRGLAGDELAAALDSACGGNAELRAHVLRLLEADREAADQSFLERHAVEDAARLLASSVSSVWTEGTVLGNYRLGSRIGAGGWVLYMKLGIFACLAA